MLVLDCGVTTVSDEFRAVMKRASSLAKKATSGAISLACPSQPIGIKEAQAAKARSGGIGALEASIDRGFVSEHRLVVPEPAYLDDEWPDFPPDHVIHVVTLVFSGTPRMEGNSQLKVKP